MLFSEPDAVTLGLYAYGVVCVIVGVVFGSACGR
jgi:hypothetical protein